MPETSQYAWDFDRPPALWMERYSTFSVGLFQWLPKAGGKGIKKSKVFSRVLGYTTEPDRVYAKAVEICGRLNRERAKAVSPPDWLQKQYSIPKPAGMVIERNSTDFTAAQVRSIRMRVMKDQLLPAGFVVGKDASYVRRRGEQIHLINFQGSKYGHKFTANLGFHYCFVPPLFHERSLPLAEFHLLDCLINERIGFFLPERRDTWFEYGEDREALTSKLSLCATTCLGVFDRCSQRWSDPSVFLDDLCAGERKTEWSGALSQYLGVACVALRIGRFGEVMFRLEKWEVDRPSTLRPLHAWLSNKLSEYGDRHSKNLNGVPLPDWIMPAGEAEGRTL